MSAVTLSRAELAGFSAILIVILGFFVWLNAYADTINLFVLVVLVVAFFALVIRASTLLVELAERHDKCKN